jgi:plastocyanin
LKRLSTLFLLVLAASAVLAVPASAQVAPAGSGEPAFTNSATNRQWFSWAAAPGADGYRIRFSYYRDNALVTEATYDQSANGGTIWADWAGIATLVEGSTYAICAQGYYSFPNDSLYFPDGPNSCSMGTTLGKRTSTTIDRTAPSTTVSLAAGAAATKQASVPLQIGFQDANAGPFPTNFVCVTAGSDPCNSLAYDADCSTPAGPGKNTSFSCQVSAAGLADGPVTACAVAADAAVPDNPSSSDQTGTATAANRSAAQCDTVVLDRVAPSVSVGASAAAPTVGQLVEFTAQATDATSGVSGAPEWTWGDNTAGGTGNAASHTFTQAGTYKVAARVSDAAGNETVAEKVVTVTAPPTQTPGGGSDPEPSAPGTQDPGDPQPTDPQPTDPQPGPQPPPDGSPPPKGGPTPEQIAKAAGGGLVVRARIDSLTLLVPKRFRLGKGRRHLVLGVATDRPGRLSIQLMRGERVVAGLQRSIQAGSAARRLRLPRKVRPGRYTLRVSFTRQGAAWAATGAAKIAFVARRS